MLLKEGTDPDLETLWRGLVEDARIDMLTSDQTTEEDDGQPWLLEDPSLQQPAMPSDRGEVALQSSYIDVLETLVAEKDYDSQAFVEDPTPGQSLGVCYEPSEALRLRRENHMLRTKMQMMERQLKEAHRRCRRSELINTRWRAQMAALRKRELVEAERTQEMARTAAHRSEAVKQNEKLRETLDAQSAQLSFAVQRCEDLDATCAHLREALSQAMGSTLSSIGLTRHFSEESTDDLIQRTLAVTMRAASASGAR